MSIRKERSNNSTQYQTEGKHEISFSCFLAHTKGKKYRNKRYLIMNLKMSDFFNPSNFVIVHRGKPELDTCNSNIVGLEYVLIALSCFSLTFKSSGVSSSACTNRWCLINASVEMPY